MQWFLLFLFIAVIIPAMLYEAMPQMYININIAVTRVPVFILGAFVGKYIKAGKLIPHLAVVGMILFGILCRHYVLMEGIKGYINRYASSVFAIALMLICTYSMRIADRAIHIRGILRFFGKYSLEFYLLNILLWELFGEIHWELYRPGRYAVMLCICAVIAPLLRKWTEKISAVMIRHRWSG